ncbi:hypothetical protein LR68_00484 [Anoxybacillus sp. BCO1]|nr:hypothetical protein LR68_00484 [Anoxybacillus sp. BCO1]
MSVKSDHRHLYLQVIDRIKKDIEQGYIRKKKNSLLSLNWQNN